MKVFVVSVLLASVSMGFMLGSLKFMFYVVSAGGSELCYKYLQLPVPPIAP